MAIFSNNVFAKLPRLLTNWNVQLAVILIVTTVAFSNIFDNGFVGDDFDFIVNWDLTRNWDSLPSILKGSVPYGHEGVYRPIRGIFYLLSYHLFGTNTTAYHFQSLLIHLTCTFLVYVLTKKITKNLYTPMVTALLFGVHPIHTEAITFITTSFDEIGSIFFFLSFIFFTQFNQKSKKKRSYHLSLLFALLAFFTYEISLTLPAVIVLYDVCFRKLDFAKLKKTYLRYLPYFSLALFYFVIRVFVLKIEARSSYQADNFFLTQFVSLKVIVAYLKLLIVPINLSINHTLPGNIFAHTFPRYNREAVLNQSVFELTSLFAIILLGTLLVWAYKSLKRTPIVTFCIGWFLITLLPALNIVIPNANLLGEKYAYIASYSFCLSTAWLFANLFDRLPKLVIIPRIALVGVLAIIVLTYTNLTYQRNKDWKDDVVLWKKTVLQSPLNSMVHYKLGSAYRDQERFDEAVRSYQTALYLTPDLAPAYTNLGVIAERKGDLPQARYYYKKALEFEPKSIEAHNNLGVVYMKESYLEAAIEYFQKALEIDPNYLRAQVNLSEAYNALGTKYAQKGEFVKATQLYNKALETKPNYAEVLNNLGTICANEGRIEEAIKYYEKALKANPNLDSTRANLEKALNSNTWILR
ncbi:MAG: tetratricopeptide repeat protein [Patescibacteria group bacterium]|jgi:tetratricopeptide (TPR) repeat protein